MKLALVSENVRIAFGSIRSNPLRTILTILIIAIGITALVGVMTAVSSMESAITNRFSSMGANSFTIENRGMNVHIGGNRSVTKNFGYISYREAMTFKEQFNFPSIVSVSHLATGSATVRYGSDKSNPNVSAYGVDENFLAVAGHEMNEGRNFSVQEIESGSHVAILGSDLVTKVFPGKENPIGKFVFVGSGRYEVVGVLEQKGAGFGNQSDNIILIPVSNVRQYFSRPSMSYRIEVKSLEPEMLEEAASEATGLFRLVRGLRTSDADNFYISKSDNLSKMLIENTATVKLVSFFIGAITLMGAAIGLMNIMLVAVTERTREIGTRKAIGANSKAIRNQFLLESVLIGQLGGIIGVVFGILVGNIMSMIMKSAFVVPWNWIFWGLFITFTVGILSGLLPAMKAAKMDPIESLRYE
jgi:putative ABC transport system permease protein